MGRRVVVGLAVVLLTTTAAAQDAGAPNVTPPDLDDVEHMCALLTGCPNLPLPSGIVPRDFAGCVRAMVDELSSAGAVGASLTLRECGLKASSCASLRTCALRGAKPDVCTGRAKTGSVDMCDADGRAITCTSEHVSMVRDCPRGGEQCVVQNGKSACALGSCENDTGPTCSPSGTRVLECKHGKLLSLDCSTFGLKCDATGTDGPRCATTAAVCAAGSGKCEAKDIAVGCWHGHEVRVDCAAAGMTCSGGACAPKPPSGDACDASSAPKCDGATLRWCAWGKPRAYICKSMGLSKCVTDEKGARCL